LNGGAQRFGLNTHSKRRIFRSFIKHRLGVLLFSSANVKGVIFDLDDTLVHTKLDFAKIKKTISCPSGADILTFIESIENKDEQALAKEIVLQHEIEDAQTSKWIEGARSFVSGLLGHGIPCAIVTRNCRVATELKVKNNDIPIDFIVTREDAPAKPDPTALNLINAKWQFETHEVAYIGDYKYDIEAAHNANMQAWLFTYDRHKSDFEDMLTLINKTDK
jgi:HAD superfamily hydrolase (TIGR01549 family)